MVALFEDFKIHGKEPTNARKVKHLGKLISFNTEAVVDINQTRSVLIIFTNMCD